MQLVASGPDIPDALLQAHEEGRVVFFCGAGISYPAGLPGFKGLVNKIYRLVGTTRNEVEQEAYERNQFDATLDLLERRLPGQRRAVRNALAKALQPKLRRKGATDTHAALLQLARSRDGALRLVTTNFDRIFVHLTARTKPAVPAYPAPLLPIPKNSRWNGLVYLHGLLPEYQDDSALNRLVLTSGDFGLAYLTERWAARFVSELFRSYVVCFVGYSINDPVLRYMMDALAADRMLGEVMPQAYALGDCTPGQESNKTVEWEAKGVTPILYEVPTGTYDHSALHHTLKVWADTYRDGILGRERIVVEYAMARPSTSTRQDDFVSRMLWALSHESGLPAKRFANLDLVPPLDWLEAFTAERYRQGDLARFGVSHRAGLDDKLRFSLIDRPTPYTCAPWMMLVSGGTIDSQWDNVMFHLACWLVRHLDNPTLILWLAERGGHLHNVLARLIEDKLNTLARLEREGKADELAHILAQAPQAIPRPSLRTLWRLLLANRVKSPRHHLGFYQWKERLIRDGLTATFRFELREMLAPKVALKKPFHWDDTSTETKAPERLRQLVDWELVLAADDVHASLNDLVHADWWHSALPALFDDFQRLLRDALDLLRELGEAEDHSDRSYWDLPSIHPHWQNRGFRDWVALIELVRNAWLAVRENDPTRATQVAQSWFAMPYPTFKRLALFAASHDGSIAPDQWVDWLVAKDGCWLWSLDTKRETLRLLVLQGTNLGPQTRGRLEAIILAGPPRAMYRDDIAPERWQELVDRSVWLHLAKLKSSGGDLGSAATERLDALSAAHPELYLESNESDEFSHWMSGTGDPDYESKRHIDHAPRKRRELVEWLKRPPPSQRPFHEDTWPETCRTRFFHCAFALCDLTREGIWPSRRWGEALQAWSEEGRVQRSWRFLAPLVETMPGEVLKGTAHNTSWWLEAAAKSLNCHEDIFLNLCRRVLALPCQDEVDTDQPVFRAINHPVGHITQALLNLWFGREPNDNDRISTDLEPIFTHLCDTSVAHFRHGRVLLASHLIAFFRVDRLWTEAHLLPLFDWAMDAAEARAAWEGFLWSPRLYQPLLVSFKAQFLGTVHHYNDLGEYARQFAAFLTYAALEPVDTYTAQDFRAALEALPKEGLHEAAQALVRALEGAGEQGEDYWANRIRPFWQDIWPKSRQLVSKGLAVSLAQLCITARNQF
ncbi:MAG: SIR2 family protein, partial [Candidatus Latescibacteria bacterium]|nr:SIR2 family protein [Candidatus Latescibacterota bacterium]